MKSRKSLLAVPAAFAVAVGAGAAGASSTSATGNPSPVVAPEGAKTTPGQFQTAGCRIRWVNGRPRRVCTVRTPTAVTSVRG